jgi:hypothetical protein
MLTFKQFIVEERKLYQQLDEGAIADMAKAIKIHVRDEKRRGNKIGAMLVAPGSLYTAAQAGLAIYHAAKGNIGDAAHHTVYAAAPASALMDHWRHIHEIYKKIKETNKKNSSNNNASPEHITKAVNDENRYVRQAAQEILDKKNK